MSNAGGIPLINEPHDDSQTLIIPKIELQLDNSDASTSYTETPPLTPASEDSVDDASTEEPTVEEVGASGSQRDSESEAPDEIMPFDANVAGRVHLYRGLERNHVSSKTYFILFVFMLISAVFSLIAYGIFIRYDEIFNIGREKSTFNLMLIPREKWMYENALAPDKWASYEAKRVVVTHTETEACETLMDCLELVNTVTEREGLFKYNFLVAPDGYVYETLGWQEPSPLFPDTPTMVIAFIGNYEERAPSVVQLAQFQTLLDESEELKYLIKTYSIHGKKFKKEPKKLYSYISKLKNWDKTRYGMDYKAYLHPELDLFLYFEL